MNLSHLSKRLLNMWCRGSSVLETTGIVRDLSLSKVRCRRLKLNLDCCKHLCEGVSLKSRFDTNRYFSDNNLSRHSDNVDMLKEEAGKIDTDFRQDDSITQKTPETFTLDVLVSLLRQENAVDLCVIKVPEHIKYTEYFLVVSGVSPRHLRAMALYAIKVYKFLKEDGHPHVKIEGKDAEDWMCIDFGNMVVHFMIPEAREVYELEKLWTLRAYDEQLKKIPAELLPEDFVLDVELSK